MTGAGVPYADPEAQRAYQRQWAARRRAEWIAGKSCVHCGALEALEVHHVDPTAKDAHRIWSWSAKRREAELAKCEVLCDPCHNRLHADRLRTPCGSTGMYKRGCRCSLCREGHAARGREYRERKAAA